MDFLLIGGGLLKAALPPVTKAIAATVQNKLHPSELERAIAIALEESEALKIQQKAWNPVFSQCEPNQIDQFLARWLEHSAVQGELQKPLQEKGLPDGAVLVAAAKQVGSDRAIPIALDHLESWLTRFAQAYFDRTSECLRFRVAQENYLNQVANWFDDVKFAGVDVPGYDVEKAEKLAQIFVMPEVREEVGSGGVGEWGSRGVGEFLGLDDRQSSLMREQRGRALGERSGRKFVAQQLLTQSVGRAVILGEPGSGKSTLVNYFAVMLALGKGEELGLVGDWLPIVIRMRDWALHPGLGVCEYVRHFAETTLSVKSLPVRFFEYWLGRGRALILLDGLDEVPEAGRRHEFVLRIENFLGQHSQNRAIVTSRPAGYRRDFFRTEEFPHYELLPFDDDRIREFIDHWYDSRVDDPAEAKRRKESLGRAIDQQDRIKLLARNPLLLTIIALIHRYQARLPKERHKLYDRAVETLLTSWDSNKELSDRTVLKFLALDDLRRLMEGLAYWIHTQGSTGDSEGGTLIDREELIEQLGKEIQALKGVKRYEAREEAKRFVGLIRERSGLLNEQGQDCYAFVHKTFQEYLAAQEIRYRADDEDEFEIVLRHIDEHLHDPHWREVLLLLVAEQPKKKAARSIRRVLEQGSEYEKWLHRDLLFAGRCLAEDPKDLNVGDPALAGEILDRLIELEISESVQVGDRVREEVFQILCNLNESAFEAEALQRVKDQSRLIEEDRLDQYQAVLERIEGFEMMIITSYPVEESRGVNFRAIWRRGDLSDDYEDALLTLLAELTHEDSEIRSEAARLLGKLGDASESVVQALLSRLTDENSEVRAQSAWALGKLGDASESVVQALLSRLADEDSEVRHFAADSLGKLGDASESVVQALLSRLADEDSSVRSKAAWALGKLGDASESVVQALLPRLTDEDSSVRSSAAWALGKLGHASEASVQDLLTCLIDGTSYVRSSAVEALGELGKMANWIEPAVVQWIEQHQDSPVAGGGIDVLWQIVAASSPPHSSTSLRKYVRAPIGLFDPILDDDDFFDDSTENDTSSSE